MLGLVQQPPDHRWQLIRVLEQIGELIDHHWECPLVRLPEHRLKRVVPVAESQRPDSEPLAQLVPEVLQRGPSLLQQRLVAEAACRLCSQVQRSPWGTQAPLAAMTSSR